VERAVTAIAARPPAARRAAWRHLPLLLAGALVLVAIAYPLTSGGGRDAVTWAIVLLGAAVSVLHAGLAHGARTGVAVLVVVVACAMIIEAIGLATGFPYGRYSYGAELGPTLLGVPFLVPLAWLMMAWPSRLLAERLASGLVPRVLVAAAVFAGWDVVLDPQMVQGGYWTWAHPRPGLPGIGTVPLTNLAGWLLAGLVVMALLEAVVARAGPARVGAAAPLLVLGWMTLGGALAHAGWLGLPGSAAWGVALAMPVLVTLAVRRRLAARR
jgi:carotene biosynthesis associated membrane protein